MSPETQYIIINSITFRYVRGYDSAQHKLIWTSRVEWAMKFGTEAEAIAYSVTHEDSPVAKVILYHN